MMPKNHTTKNITCQLMMTNQFEMTFKSYKKSLINSDDELNMNSKNDKKHNKCHMTIDDDKSN